MIESIASFEGRMAKVEGPARSGKTEALIQRCIVLLERGVAPESLLIETTTAQGAIAFRTRLHTALTKADNSNATEISANICVSTALDTCVELLSQPTARKATGRIPRILNNVEYNFFLEDMKTLGQPVRRLRKMLDFFYYQWSKLAPESEWLLGGEEARLREHLDRVLRSEEAMLPEEAATLCAAYLMSEEGRQARGRFDYVLCDDFQNLSYAEQTCLCLLASKQIMVCGNVNQTHRTRKTNPYPQGFVQFDVLRREVETFTLTTTFGSSAVAAFANGLCKQGDMDVERAAEAQHVSASARNDVICIKWSTPEEEFDGLTKYLRVLTDAESDPRESNTCILVPNKRWARTVQQVLEQRGFNVSCAGASLGLSGDPREAARAKELLAYVKLNLLANPHDTIAWRCWCGFDNYLTNSDAWEGLLEYAESQGLSLLDALENLATLEKSCSSSTDETSKPLPFPRADILVQRWKTGRLFIEQNTARKGFTLLHAIEADNLPIFQDVARMLDGDEPADQLFDMARSQNTDPVFPNELHTLHVALPQALCGTSYDKIVVLAAIDGFTPHRNAFELISTEEDRTAALNEERRLFYDAVSKAEKSLVISCFEKTSLELAERTKMQVVRITAENDDRIAIVRPSTFLTEAGDACPGMVGGQSLLAEYDLA
ncbi:MAG: UvrD-helicase domain-containing protein [Gordonibacter sp.]|nr:UvrD-helicase domain-containing protein [Gordonibacter sp.]